MLQPWTDTLLDRMAVKLMNAAASRVEGKLEQDIASVKGELLSASLRYEATFGPQADDIRQRLSQVSSWLGHDQPLESSLGQKPEELERVISLLLANSANALKLGDNTQETSKATKGGRKSGRSDSNPELDLDGVPKAKRRRGRPKKKGRGEPSLSTESVEPTDERDEEVLQ